MHNDPASRDNKQDQKNSGHVPEFLIQGSLTRECNIVPFS